MRNPARDIPHYLRIFRTYLGGRMYLILALTLVAGLAEGVGILMLLPLLQNLDAGSVAQTATPTELSGISGAPSSKTSRPTCSPTARQLQHDRPGDNPKTAVHEYLKTHPEFEIDKQIDHKLLISVAPDGYLRHV